MKTERNDMGKNRKTLKFLIILVLLVIFIMWIYGWYNQTPLEFSNPSDVNVTVENGGLERFELTETQRTKFLLLLEELKVKRTHKVRAFEAKITVYIYIFGNGGKNTPVSIFLNKEYSNKPYITVYPSKSYIVDRNKTYLLTKLQSEELLKIIIGFSNSNS